MPPGQIIMPKTVKKADLPAKTCVQCGRPFTWRRKWALVWEQVRYCSDACRRGKVPDRAGAKR